MRSQDWKDAAPKTTRTRMPGTRIRCPSGHVVVRLDGDVDLHGVATVERTCPECGVAARVPVSPS